MTKTIPFFNKGLAARILASLALVVLGLLGMASPAQAQFLSSKGGTDAQYAQRGKAPTSAVGAMKAPMGKSAPMMMSGGTPTPPPAVEYTVETNILMESAGTATANYGNVGNAWAEVFENHNSGVDVNFAADPNCGPTCGQQVVRLWGNSQQQAISGAYDTHQGDKGGAVAASNGAAYTANNKLNVKFTSPTPPQLPVATPKPAPAPGGKG